MCKRESLKSRTLDFGVVFHNILTIESLMRLYLDKKDDIEIFSSRDLEDLKEGDNVDICWLTKGKSFEGVITRYNKECSEEGKVEGEEKGDLINLRNALAHGFIYSKKREGNEYLLNFGKIKEGKSIVKYCEIMSEEWLKKKIGFTGRVIKRILTAYEKSSY